MYQNPTYCSAHVARCQHQLQRYRAEANGLVAVLLLATAVGLALVVARDLYRRGRTVEAVTLGAAAAIITAFGPALVHLAERAA